MAQDDWEVIEYKILRYLYDCLKADVVPELGRITWNSELISVNKNYWCKITATLVASG